MSLQRWPFQEIAAIGRLDLHVLQAAVARERDRDLGAGRAEMPDAAQHVGEARHVLAGDFDDRVAAAHARTFGRTAFRQAPDDDAVALLRRVHSEPRMRRPRRPAELQHVVENRRLYAQKFDAVVPLLEKSFDAKRPEGGFYLWMRTPIDDTEFTRLLHREYNVLVLPGSYLARDVDGENPGKKHVRIALVAPLDECVEAARRIMQFAMTL